MSWWTVPDVPPAEAVGVIYIIEPLFVGQNLVFVVAPSYFMGRIAIIPAQDIARDSGEIMIQKITQTYFQNNIQKYIPYEYWRMDAKPIEEGGSDGDMAIFTEVFAITMDEIKQAIDELPLLFDIDHCPPRYLRVIAELLNFPLEDVDSTAEQRRQLKDAVNWYRSKGSRKAFISILYAFGFYVTMVPLWTEDYLAFTDTIPGVAKGNDPPNDYPLLLENGGTWYRSPHYGIYLQAIVEDRHATIEWGSVPENQVPITNEIVDTTPDGIETSFAGWVTHYPTIAGTFTGTAFVSGWPVTDIVDNGSGVLSGTDITGTIDYATGAWTLDFTTAPADGSAIILGYNFDFADLVENIGYHRAFYQMLDELSAAGVVLNYQFDTDTFNYLYRRIEFLRPVFAVLEWLGKLIHMQEEYVVPEGEEPMMTANPVRDEKGWYLGYCDMDDLQYTRLDARLLGPNMRGLTSPLGAGAPSVIDIEDEVAYIVSGSLSFISGTLTNSWLFSGVNFTATIGASLVDITDISYKETTNEVIDTTANGVKTSFSGQLTQSPLSVPTDFKSAPDSFDTHACDIDSHTRITFTTEQTKYFDVYGRYTDATHYGWGVGCTMTGTLRVIWNDGGGIHSLFSENSVFSHDVAYQVDVVVEGATIKVYVDGVLKTTRTLVYNESVALGAIAHDYVTNDIELLTYPCPAPGRILALTFDLGAGMEEVTIVDNGIEFVGTDSLSNAVTGIIDHVDGTWSLDFISVPVADSLITMRYTYAVTEGVLNAEGVIGVIDYLDGSWWMDFETGYEPDDATDVLADYSYSTEIPPTDRSGVMPRGSTELPFPHVRDPQEGYCHPPEELWIDWYWIQPEDYRLPLTRDGMNLYPPAGPVLYIDHADFPSRGFTKAASVADHANTFTRELGYSDRALSLLEVTQNPPASAEDWQNQGTAWESWTGPWENIGD
jgi:hypothetical protein